MPEDTATSQQVILSRFLKLDDWIAGFLMGLEVDDPKLLPFSVDVFEHEDTATVSHQRENMARWLRATTLARNGREPVLLIRGGHGAKKHAFARRFASALDVPIKFLNAGALRRNVSGVRAGMRLAERNAWLIGTVPCWFNVDRFLNPRPGDEAASIDFVDGLAGGSVVTFLLAEQHWEPGTSLGGRAFVSLALPKPDFDERLRDWRAAAAQSGAMVEKHVLETLAGRFNFGDGQIRDVLAQAAILASLRGDESNWLSGHDLLSACRVHGSQNVGSITTKLNSNYTWRDMVLSHAQRATLWAICETLSERHTVYSSWGFSREGAGSRNVMALFVGSPGSGKKLAAQILANHLGLDLYRVDIAAVLGEHTADTQKRFETIFQEVDTSDAILYFDGADALFGKRSDVKDSRDRHANLETASLLQCTEAYDGLVILATDFDSRLDQAFLQTTQFVVNFHEPTADERLLIWQTALPTDAPKSTDLDLELLAQVPAEWRKHQTYRSRRRFRGISGTRQDRDAPLECCREKRSEEARQCSGG